MEDKPALGGAAVVMAVLVAVGLKGPKTWTSMDGVLDPFLMISNFNPRYDIAVSNELNLGLVRCLK